MGIKGRRRSANARAFETAPSRSSKSQTCAVIVEATPLPESAPGDNQHSQPSTAPLESSASSSSTPSSSRPHVVSLVRKKRRGVGLIAVVRYSDGSRYEGQTSEEERKSDDDSATPNVLRHGKGVYVTHNGHVFDGEWVHSVFQGWVTLLRAA